MASEKQSGSSADQSKQQGGSGNFANNPQRASEAGKKGGEHSRDRDTGQSNQSGSGQSQQGGTKEESDKSSGKERGSNQNQR